MKKILLVIGMMSTVNLFGMLDNYWQQKAQQDQRNQAAQHALNPARPTNSHIVSSHSNASFNDRNQVSDHNAGCYKNPAQNFSHNKKN